MQFNLLDYIIIAVIFLSILAGYKLGFIKAITSIISTITAVILALVWYDDFIIHLNNYFDLQIYLSEVILSKLIAIFYPLDVLILADYLPIEGKLTELADKFSYYIMIILSFFIIFFGSRLILTVLSSILESLFSFSFLSWINRLLGMIIIPAKNLIMLIILLGITYPLIELGAEIGLSGPLIIMSLIEGSIITESLLNYFQVVKGLIIV